MSHPRTRSWRRAGRVLAAAAASVLMAGSAALTTGGSAAAAPANTAVNTTSASSHNPGEYQWCQFRIRADVLNVRSSPSLSAPVIYQLRYGDVVYGAGRTHRADGVAWRNLNYSGSRYQWAAAQYMYLIPGTCHTK